MKLVTIYTVAILYFAVSRATFVDHEVEDEALAEEDWDDELGLEPVHYTLEKRACCNKNKFSACYAICSLGCKPPPGCPTCGQSCFTRCSRVCCKSWFNLVHEMLTRNAYIGREGVTCK
ncbi:hypothetical protein CPB86DRAFT_549810 [Serendipita vermifera]|nr:hypothetical protein CPB86DRAFT_549810 [Serendipita vermifera]